MGDRQMAQCSSSSSPSPSPPPSPAAAAAVVLARRASSRSRSSRSCGSSSSSSKPSSGFLRRGLGASGLCDGRCKVGEARRGGGGGDDVRRRLAGGDSGGILGSLSMCRKTRTDPERRARRVDGGHRSATTCRATPFVVPLTGTHLGRPPASSPSLRYTQVTPCDPPSVPTSDSHLSRSPSSSSVSLALVRPRHGRRPRSNPPGASLLPLAATPADPAPPAAHRNAWQSCKPPAALAAAPLRDPACPARQAQVVRPARTRRSRLRRRTSAGGPS